jgi:hypothetical protein
VYDANDPQKAKPTTGMRSMTCGWPDRVSEIRWGFVRRKGAQDVYRFERRFPLDGPECQSTSNVVAFDGAQVVVFQDEHQVIVLDAPEGD